MPYGSKTWWEVPETKVFEEVSGLVQLIRQNSIQHAQDLLKSFRLYGNFESRGLSAGNYFRPNTGRSNRLTLNVIKSCVSTVSARVAKDVPKSTFLTSGGSWSQQKKAKLLDKFAGGIRYQTRFPQTARRIFKDTAVFGKGVAKVFENARKRVAIERVFPDEIVVDEMEAADGSPRQMFQTKLVAREKLLRMRIGGVPIADIPALADKVKKTKAAMLGSESQRQIESADLIQVVESWHLPSDPIDEFDGDTDIDPAKLRAKLMEGHDGRHAITVENATLLMEAWRSETFPFVFLEWDGPLKGFWPVGLPMELIGIQYEINKILRKIQESIDWCVPKAFVESSSKVVLNHLDDVIGGIIRYTGTKPEIAAQNTVSPILLQQVERLIQQAYEISGISQLSAQSKKPAGLESGASLREYHDIESERFSLIDASFEEFCVEIDRRAIQVARRIADRDGDYGVQSPQRKRRTVRIDWSEIGLEDDDFVMEVFPSSSLPRTPAGRLAMVQDLMNIGFLDKEDALRLLNFPDVEAVNELNEAAAEFTNWQLEQMIEKGRPQTPMPFQNLAYALKHAQAAYLLASTMEDVPASRLEMVQEYMEECHALLQAASQPPPAPGAQPGIPGGPPTMPAPGMPMAGRAVDSGMPIAPQQPPPPS